MKTILPIKHGNFTGLAENYSKYRPSYSQTVLNSILNLFKQPINKLNFVDIGAGTGIWTRLLACSNPHSIIGVEPNEDMLNAAKKDSLDLDINWLQADAEKTNLPSSSADLISMASSFHWTDFETTLAEFHRILKTNGYFVALWNPRNLTNNLLLLEIEDFLFSLKPDMQRVSSGSANSTEILMNKLKGHYKFNFTLYLEADLDRELTPAEYLGVWDSVNDIKFQLGPEKFEQFMTFIEDKTKDLKTIRVSNTTRAWVFQKKS